MNYEEIALDKIGEFIGSAIKERGLSLYRIEKDSGVSRTILYKILRGQNYEVTSLIRVMRHLQIHLELSLMDESNTIMTMGGAGPSVN